MPRLFIALPLPDAEKSRLTACQRALEAQLAPQQRHALRWTPPEQMHVTVRFVGTVPPDAVPRLREALATVRTAPLQLTLGGLGTFPATGAPRVLWAAVAPHAPLQALKQQVDAAVGPDPESPRGYHPHATLARIVDKLPARLFDELQAGDAALRALVAPGPPLTIDQLVLYESVTTSRGAQHTPLLAHPLGALTWPRDETR